MKRLTVPGSAFAALGGGTALMVGALAPWMSFFVGLKPLRGTTGPNGYIFIVCGILAIGGAVALMRGAGDVVRRALGTLGMVLTVFASWLLWRLDLTVRHIAMHDPMMLPRFGPGLFIVWAGGVAVATVMLSRSRAPGHLATV